jgi:hypothetical protein
LVWYLTTDFGVVKIFRVFAMMFVRASLGVLNVSGGRDFGWDAALGPGPIDLGFD